MAQAVATELLPFQERGDWDGALQVRATLQPYLSPFFLVFTVSISVQTPLMLLQ